MKNVAYHNLGCKVNTYEMDVVLQMLREKGYRIVPFDQRADIYLINTCTVTNIADRKSRQMIHRARARNPQALVVAMGCYVQTGMEKVLADEGVDLAVGNNRKGDIVSLLEKSLRERELASEENRRPDKTLGGASLADISQARDYEDMTLRETAEHTRACIKIQDGCNQFCSYCIIPYARGRVRSRGSREVLEEVKGLLQAGYREIVLTGIHISSFGTDRGLEGGEALLELLRGLDALEGLERIRLGSLEPRIVTPGFVSGLAEISRLCPHFHLSLQSGCDETLRRMNREYTSGQYYECVELLRKAFQRPAITTDVIAGFPQETEEEFEISRRFLEKVGFYEMHVFPYSRRKGTLADGMSGQVPEEVKARRTGILLELRARQSRAFREYYIGREAQVLFEEEKRVGERPYRIGHTRDYVKVALPAGEDVRGRLLNVQVQDFLTDEILLADPASAR